MTTATLDKELSARMERQGAHLIDGICRLVYLQPNPYSDEALVVAVLLDHGSRLYFDRIVSPDNYRALECLFGEQMREQTIFALDVLREHVYSSSFSLSETDSPTDLLRLGAVFRVSCDEPEKYARDLLRISSSLYRTFRIEMEDAPSVNQKQMADFLRASIIRLNLFKGEALIKPKRLRLKNKGHIEIPIYGDMVMGSPISMATRELGGAKTQAEAAIARLHYAREILTNRTPVIFVYAPLSEKSADNNRVEDTLGELEVVGRSSEVEICPEDTIEKLARAVFRYENVSLY
jgi:hypothetical protein